MKRSLIAFPFLNPMAPVDDAGGGPTVDVDDIDLSTMDRGDDFDPSLFDDDDAGKPSAPSKGKSDEEEKVDNKGDGKKPDTKKPDDVDKGDGKGDGKPADDKGDGKPADDKGDTKPKKPSAAEKRIKQLLEDKAALESRLQRRAADEKITGELADLEKRASEAEKKYHEYLSSDPDKAQSMLAEIRAIDRSIAKLEASAEAESMIDQRFEQKEFERTLSSIIEKHPELDSKNEDKDAIDWDSIEEINMLFSSFLAGGMPKARAMERAVGYVIKPKQDEAPAALGDTKDTIRAQREEEARTRAAKANGAQPPSAKDAGVADTARVKTPKSVKDLDDMTEEELAIARGDMLAE